MQKRARAAVLRRERGRQFVAREARPRRARRSSRESCADLRLVERSERRIRRLLTTVVARRRSLSTARGGYGRDERLLGDRRREPRCIVGNEFIVGDLENHAETLERRTKATSTLVYAQSKC